MVVATDAIDGCFEYNDPSSATTAELVRTAADKLGIPVQIETVTDYSAIAGYGVVSTPGIVIDGKVVHAGGLPEPDDLARWLAS